MTAVLQEQPCRRAPARDLLGTRAPNGENP